MKHSGTGHLVPIEVNKDKFEAFLFEYGPALVLGEFVLALAAIALNILYLYLVEDPRMLSWAVVTPVYGAILIVLFVEAIAVRSFLKRIPQAFAQIRAGGLIKESLSGRHSRSAFGQFLREFERRLNSPWRLFLGLPLALLSLSFFWRTGHVPYVVGLWLDGGSMLTALAATAVNALALFVPGLIVGYAVGIAAWKSLVTAASVNRFCRDFPLVIQASHPDKAGGLKPLGGLIFSLASIVIIASLALSGLVVAADLGGFPNTVMFAKAFMMVSIMLSIIVFVWPLLSAHERMLIEKSRSERLLLEIARRISELEGSVRTNIRKSNYRRRQEILSEVDSLKDLYRRVLIAPTWPFDRDIVWKFATPQIVPLLSLVGVAQPLMDAARSVLAALAGGQP